VMGRHWLARITRGASSSVVGLLRSYSLKLLLIRSTKWI
jgi:hypothetical protein